MYSIENSSHYIDITKGYAIKTILDILANSLSRSTLNINKEGMILQDHDISKTMLYRLFIDRNKIISPYKSAADISISFNFKHVQKQIKSVQRKNSITFIITKDNPNYLILKINSKSNGDSDYSESEIVSTVIQYETLPDLTPVFSKEDFHFPIVIPSIKFQKVKKLLSGKTITVTIQESNYLEFSYDMGGKICESKIIIGKLKTEKDIENENNIIFDGKSLGGIPLLKKINKEDEIKEFINSAIQALKTSKIKGRIYYNVNTEKVHAKTSIMKQKYSFYKIDGSINIAGSDESEEINRLLSLFNKNEVCSYNDIEENIQELVSNNLEESSQENNEKNKDLIEIKLTDLYSEDFPSNKMKYLTKLQTVSKKIQLYSPKFKGYPLKIEVNPEDLGEFTIYMKDKHQIDYDKRIESQKADNIILVKKPQKRR